MLCSDGLTGQVKDEEIGVILATLPPAEAAQALIDLANLRGGPDNITALIIQVTGQAVAARGNTQAAPFSLADDRAVPAAPPPAAGKYWIAAAAVLWRRGRSGGIRRVSLCGRSIGFGCGAGRLGVLATNDARATRAIPCPGAGSAAVPIARSIARPTKRLSAILAC